MRRVTLKKLGMVIVGILWVITIVGITLVGCSKKHQNSEIQITETVTETLQTPVTTISMRTEAAETTLTESDTETIVEAETETQAVTAAPVAYVDTNVPDQYKSLLPVPAGLSSQSKASEYSVQASGGYYNNYVNQKVVYLTFSISSKDQYVESIMNILDSRGVKASFFVSVREFFRWKSKDIYLLQNLVSHGHIVGSHGYGHDYTYTLSDANLINDIYNSVTTLSNAIGQQIVWYRPPSGFISNRDIYIANGMGLRVAACGYYAKDYDFSNQPSKETELAALKENLGHASVYYMHVSKCNVEALGDFIDYAKEKGYEFLLLGQAPGDNDIKETETTTENITEAETTTEYVTESETTTENVTEVETTAEIITEAETTTEIITEVETATEIVETETTEEITEDYTEEFHSDI